MVNTLLKQVLKYDRGISSNSESGGYPTLSSGSSALAQKKSSMYEPSELKTPKVEANTTATKIDIFMTPPLLNLQNSTL